MGDAGETGPRHPGQWATLTFSLRGGAIDLAALVEASDHMQDLAALLALENGVLGVETRDPKTSPVERPEIVVYAAPERLESLVANAQTLADALALDVVLRSEVHDDEDWKDAWKAHYRPLVFGGGRLLVRPSWLERRADDPTAEIILDPGRAFGTGLHESTASCLEELCALRASTPTVVRALDLGCGSGILGLAALRLWPDTLTGVLAVDDDPEAVEVAQHNALRNELEGSLECVVGTADTVAAQRFDLVVANIRSEVLVPLARTLLDLAASPSTLVLGGILAEEADEVRAAYVAAGWHGDSPPRRLGDWVSLRFWTGARS
jgi:ribosomal protein L11 methyltransferase